MQRLYTCQENTNTSAYLLVETWAVDVALTDSKQNHCWLATVLFFLTLAPIGKKRTGMQTASSTATSNRCVKG